MTALDQTQVTLIATLVSSVLAFLGTIFGIVTTIYKENRARRWALEDARALAKHTDDALKESARTTKQEGEARLAIIQGGHEELKKEIAANTEISKEAFREANGVNAKLEKLGVKLAEEAVTQKVVVVNENPIPVKTQ